MREQHQVSRFERELSSLKESGSSLLLVGTIPNDRFYEMGIQLLGDADQAPRRRVLAGPEDAIQTQIEELSGEAVRLDGDRIRAINFADQTRSAVAQSAKTPESVPVELVPRDDPAALAWAIKENINQLEQRGGVPNPAELRVGIDGMTDLLKANGDETVFRFVHMLNALVKRRSGMIHYILPIERDGVTVRTLQPLFDAII
ncbi:MAG: hypothetical protein ABEI52_06620, partial [Halobacteriaceae archaeon]